MLLSKRVRKNKLAVVIALMVVVILLSLGVAAGLMASSGSHAAAPVAAQSRSSTAPATTTPSESSEPGKVAVPSEETSTPPQAKPFKADAWARLGSHLVVLYSSKHWWLNTPPAPDIYSLNFVQKCPNGAECPTISIVDKHSPSWVDDPLAEWKQQACVHSVPGSVQGPTNTTLGGANAKRYFMGCQDGTDNYLWLDEKDGVVVEVADNGGYDIDEERVEIVLTHVERL